MISVYFLPRLYYMDAEEGFNGFFEQRSDKMKRSRIKVTLKFLSISMLCELRKPAHKNNCGVILTPKSIKVKLE